MKKSWYETDLPMGDIVKFSGVVRKFLTAAAVINVILMLSLILSEALPVLGGAVDYDSGRFFTMEVFGWRVINVELISLYIGQRAVFVPAAPFGLVAAGHLDLGHLHPALHVGIIVLISLIGHGLFMAVILYLRVVFKELQGGASPFSRKMVWRIFIFAFITTTMLFTTNFSLTSILFAVFMWLLYCIFSYGSKLQEESDTTL